MDQVTIGTIIASNVVVCLVLRKFSMEILLKIDDFLQAVKEIDLTPNFEMNGEAMEAQIQAQKQAQIFEFLKSLVQPQISVSEIQSRGKDGQFTKDTSL